MPFWKRGDKQAPAQPQRPSAKVVPAPSPPPTAPPTDPDRVVSDAHHRLAEAGLTIEGTREVFRKRLAEKFGSIEAFVRQYQTEGPKTITQFLASWIGFHVAPEFTLVDLLYNANQRLSSFGLQVNSSEEVRVNDAEGTREATVSLGERATVIQFRTPREVFNEINDFLAENDVRFLQLETWSDASAFMLARSPQLDKLAAGDLVVVKEVETAVAGECPECGYPTGKNWARCIACGSPL